MKCCLETNVKKLIYFFLQFASNLTIATVYTLCSLFDLYTHSFIMKTSFTLVGFDLFCAKLLGVLLGGEMALFQCMPSEGVERRSFKGMEPQCNAGRASFGWITGL